MISISRKRKTRHMVEGQALKLKASIDKLSSPITVQTVNGPKHFHFDTTIPQDELKNLPRYKHMNIPTLVAAYIYENSEFDPADDDAVYFALMAVYDLPSLDFTKPLDAINNREYVRLRADIYRYQTLISSESK